MVRQVTALNFRPTPLIGAPKQIAAAPPAPPVRKNDPLADALIFLAAFHGRALSREALLSGLPIEDGRLTVALFERAAARAGLETEAVKRNLQDIPALVLPAVLIMKDGTTRILTSAGKDPKVIDPSQAAPRPAPIGADAQNYLGYTFFVRPAAQTETRVAGAPPAQAHWFWSVCKRFWENYSHVAVAALVVNLLALASPIFTMNVYDRVVPNGAIPSLVALAIGMVIAVVFDFVLRMVRGRIVDVTGKKIDVVLAARIFEHVQSVKMAARPTSVGVLANQLRDFDSVREFFTSGTVVAVTDMLFAFVFIGVLFIVAGPLAWIPIVILPVMIALGFLLQRPLQAAMKRLQGESAARHGVLVESLSSLETVRAVGAEARMQSRWERSVAATARSSEDVQFWASLALNASSTAQQVATLLMMVIGVFLILDGKLSVGALVAASMLSGRVLGPITGIAAMITRASQTVTSLNAIDTIMKLERERPPGRAFIARRIDRGSIAFDNVTFKYPNAAENALEKVSFRINSGERVGIIGRVGSGKTTVGRLMSGFYDPADGKVIVDDIDLRQYDPADLRTGLGFVLQDTDLFFGKLRENIALGYPEATDEEIVKASRLAGVETFIAGHPLGYEMPVSEGGKSLSGGQKQAIGLARALIRNPRILFLDEPTAHFDIRSEAEFLERLKTISPDTRTVIISSHRMSVLNFVDRILLFEKGRLVADGPREKVIAMLTNREVPQAASVQGASVNARH
jgi:ATP-binding cassette subfamily C protein LapB